MNTPNSIRIMLVDDHVLMRSAVRAEIESRPRMKVTCEAKNDSYLLDLAARREHDIIVYDGDDKGLRTVPELLRIVEPAGLVVLTSEKKFAWYHDVTQSGARGLVWKHQSGTTLARAIQSVYEGQTWFERAVRARKLMEMESPAQELTVQEMDIATLTTREREVIDLLGQGLGNKEISECLQITVATVRHHFSSIYSKLRVSDRFNLLIYAYQYGLVNQPA
jgi:DNA-binding NarL/FixJ family response regulator